MVSLRVSLRASIAASVGQVATPAQAANEDQARGAVAQAVVAAQVDFA